MSPSRNLKHLETELVDWSNEWIFFHAINPRALKTMLDTQQVLIDCHLITQMFKRSFEPNLLKSVWFVSYYEKIQF